MDESIPTEIGFSRLHAAYVKARDALLAERVPEGHWVGELSTSALSTATAVMALHLVNPFEHREQIDSGLSWLADHQNSDGGWGDTVVSFSNISTSMLCRAAFALVGAEKSYSSTIAKLEEFITLRAGSTPAQRAEAIRRRYGKDRTFSVPILMSCALGRLVPWDEVPRLPFELACLPQSWYRFAQLPVVSYALPALIAIGQCVHMHRRSFNPVRNFFRWLAHGLSLKVLRGIQPSCGGYLEATPLTSFVVMALASIQRRRLTSEQLVIDEGIRFICTSRRPDGSWPIDTNLATWVTTLSVNALAAADDLQSLDSRESIRFWLSKQQYLTRHPYTGAGPGGWAWTELPGGVPDCDDTPGAILALSALSKNEADVIASMRRAGEWILSLQNRDGGFPTFCRGWGTLPFDRSGCDLTAHALRALRCIPVSVEWPLERFERVRRSALAYLTKNQQPEGYWLPLWFGNQYAPDDVNPIYGTARVLAAYRDLDLMNTPEAKKAIAYLWAAQNADGGWGGAPNCPSSVEETALVVEVLSSLGPSMLLNRGIEWLVNSVETDCFGNPTPIGFYFAKLWYFEKLYPLIFTVAALGILVKIRSNSVSRC